MSDKHVLTVAPDDPRGAADFLVARLGLAPRVARAWLDLGAVQAGGRALRPGATLEPGTRVVARAPRSLRPAALRVLHEDADLLIVDKPAGLPSQPTPGQTASLHSQARQRHPLAHLVNRLDRDASGLVLFTLGPEASRAIQLALDDGAVTREYLALCQGRVAEPLTIRLRIATDGRDASRRRAVAEQAPEGQAACTHVEPLPGSPPPPGGTEARTLVRVRLESGRTHQIRVHLAAIGHPLVGDRLYGGAPAGRLMLHAARLVLPHPRSGAPLAIDSPLPDGFAT